MTNAPQTLPGYRPLCPQCRYPMLPLKGFEGISSKDALRDYNDRDAEHYRFFGWWAFAYDILRECGSGLWVAWRKRKVKKLRDATLPQFPNALVCPYCLQVLRKA